MTPAQLSHLRQLLDEATPGPWFFWSDEGRRGARYVASVCNQPVSTAATDGAHRCLAEGFGETEEVALANASIIAAAVSALPELLDEVERLREALKPFVEGAQVWSSHCYGDDGYHCFTARRVSVEDYDRARQLLECGQMAAEKVLSDG